jgi:antitoxin YefM
LYKILYEEVNVIKTVPVSEARQTLPDLITRMRKLMDRVIITRKGKPEAVMMAFDEYESWVETLELMSRPETVKGIREGLEDLKAGRSRSFEEVFGEPLHGKSKKR